MSILSDNPRPNFPYTRAAMPVCDDLKRLRQRAKPIPTVREMAEKLGISRSAYHFYESSKGFKQHFLPMDLARRIATILSDRGVDPDEVMALAGVAGGESGTALSVGEEKILDSFRGLTSEQRILLQMLADQMSGLSSAGPEGGGIRPSPQAANLPVSELSARSKAA